MIRLAVAFGKKMVRPSWYLLSYDMSQLTMHKPQQTTPTILRNTEIFFLTGLLSLLDIIVSST